METPRHFGHPSESRSGTPHEKSYSHSLHREAPVSPYANSRNSLHRTASDQMYDINTIMLRNLAFSTTHESIRHLASEFGEIAKLAGGQISTRGICFVTYYDSRCASKAEQMMNNVMLDGRMVQTGLAFWPKNGKMDLINPVVSLFASSDISHLPSIERCKAVIESKFGEISQITPGSRGEVQVLFYDGRASSKLLNERRIMIDSTQWAVDMKNPDSQTESSQSLCLSPNMRRTDSTTHRHGSRDSVDESQHDNIHRHPSLSHPYIFQKQGRPEVHLMCDIGSDYINSLEILKSRIGV